MVTNLREGVLLKKKYQNVTKLKIVQLALLKGLLQKKQQLKQPSRPNRPSKNTKTRPPLKKKKSLLQEIAADVTDDDDEADDVTASVEPTRPDDIKQTKYGTVQISPRSKRATSKLQQIAHEVGSRDICVNAVCPSQTKTNMLAKSMTQDEIEELGKSIPLQRIAEVPEVVYPILFLCSGEASYITGTTLDVNGGQL